jgi:hypothetical protein
MYNNFVIDRLLHEHEAIRAQTKLVVGMVNGWNINASGAVKAEPDITRQKLNLQQAIGYLDEGLRQQYSYEDEVLPLLIGDPLKEAILTERRTMMKRLAEINFLLLYISPEGLVAIWDDLKKVIANFSYWLVDHNTLEDVMLKNLQTNLSEQPRALVNSL